MVVKISEELHNAHNDIDDELSEFNYTIDGADLR
jgi:hypothetical protein